MNTWGNKIRLSIFGESHGKAIGIVINGIEPGIKIDLEKIKKDMARRAPGRNTLSTQRKEGDNFGCAGYCVPPMYRDGLAAAMEKMCESRRRRIRMGKSGQARTKAYYRHERMISEYRKLYREVEEAYGRDWI